MLKSIFRLHASESVQFFQFDSDGNMYIFEPGAGCTGEAKLVRPGDEMIFNSQDKICEDSQIVNRIESNQKLGVNDTISEVRSTQQKFNTPTDVQELDKLSCKNFSDETMKKVNWATKMYDDWRVYRNTSSHLQSISCNIF